MAVKIDLPTLSASGDAPLLLDASASFSILSDQGSGYMWTERYAQKKDAFTPLAIGTFSNIRSGYYLVKEQNFRDIGGGFFEWDRLYANIPNDWSSYELINIPVFRTFFTQIVSNETQSRLRFIGLNPKSVSPNGSIQIGVQVERTYALESTLESLSLEGEANEVYSPLLAVGQTFTVTDYEVRPPVAEPYVGEIYEIRRYKLTYTWTSEFN